VISAHLSLVNRHAAALDERVLVVEHVGHPVSIRVVGNLVVIPDGNPGKLLVARQEVGICAIGGDSLSIVVQAIPVSWFPSQKPLWSVGKRGILRQNLPIRLRDTIKRISPSILAILVLINVVSKMHHIIDRVLAHGIPVRIEEAKSYTASARQSPSNHEPFHSRKLEHEYTANLISLATFLPFSGIVFVLPTGE
jgi:hypothetical protein